MPRDKHAPPRRPTLKDIAREADVDASTVSRALNPARRLSVSADLRERIEAIAARLNYQPNAIASGLRTNRTRMIGVLIPDLTNPVFPPIIQGIEMALAERDYMPIVVNTEPTHDKHTARIQRLRAHNIDGLIVASLQWKDPALSRIVDSGLPVVTVNRRSDDPAIVSVTNDENAGLRFILEHLQSLGHVRVANIAGPQHISTGIGRYEAFQRHRHRLGLDRDESLVVVAERLNEAEGERCAAELIENVPGITAIVASNDRLAVGALATLKARGISCPGQISVTGFNDMPLVDRLDPPLTTVRVAQIEVGRRAVEALLAQIEDDGTFEPEAIVMPVELVKRGSTAPPAVRFRHVPAPPAHNAAARKLRDRAS